jgi:hypothetical protein
MRSGEHHAVLGGYPTPDATLDCAGAGRSANRTGRIHWEVTETSTKWMGYIEGGAVRSSGERAAEEVLARLKSEVKPWRQTDFRWEDTGDDTRPFQGQ